MGREIKGLIIGAVVSGAIHCALFFAPISPISAFPHVQEIAGSIEISLGAYQEAERERSSPKTVKTEPPRQEIKASELSPSPIEEDDTIGENHPNLRGDSTLAIPRQEGNPKPPYPPLAYRRGYEGKVRLKVEVMASGQVGRIWITKSSGYKILDRSALKTVKDWRFIPARFGGIPVKSTVIVPITFTLKE